MDKIFRSMNKDKDSKITYNEFVECSKQDPTVMDVRLVPRPSSLSLFSLCHRHSRSTTALYSPAAFNIALDAHCDAHITLDTWHSCCIQLGSCRLLPCSTLLPSRICIVCNKDTHIDLRSSRDRISSIIFHNLPYLFSIRVSTSSPIHLCMPSANSR